MQGAQRTPGWWLLLPLLCLCFLRPVQAEEGSITIRLKDLGTPMEQVTLELYRVGDMEGSTPVIDGFFHIRTFPEEAWRLEQAAAAISGKLNRSPDQSRITDGEGCLVFRNLKQGVYLLRLSEGGDTYGTISPFLVFLPYYESGILKNELEIQPKASPPEPTPTPAVPVSGRSDSAQPTSPAASKQGASAVPVKTGDTSDCRGYAALLILSAALSAALILHSGMHSGKGGKA